MDPSTPSSPSTTSASSSPSPPPPSATIPAKSPPNPTDSPPYWQRRDRGDSLYGTPADRPHRTITLEDHTAAGTEQSKALWARAATVDEYTRVQGGRPTSLGAYVVWVCSVQTQRGGVIKIRKRYSEFDELRRSLARTFPHSRAALPPLPPKSVIARFNAGFLEKRRVGLQYFLNCVLLNPEFSSAPVLKEFLFERG